MPKPSNFHPTQAELEHLFHSSEPIYDMARRNGTSDARLKSLFTQHFGEEAVAERIRRSKAAGHRKRGKSDAEFLAAFQSDTPLRELPAVLGLAPAKITERWTELLGEAAVIERRRKFFAMAGKKRVKPEKTYTSRGYVLVTAPEWYTGKKVGRRVPEHVLVMCEHLNVTHISDDMVVHHKNEDKTDNRIENLELMTNAEHMRLHRKQRQPKRGAQGKFVTN